MTNSNEQNKNPDFIGSWYLKDDSIIDDLLNLYKNNHKSHHKGVTESGVNEEWVKSVDFDMTALNMDQNEFKILTRYLEFLKECFYDYKSQYNHLETMFNNLNCNEYMIKKYEKGDHYHKVHCERSETATALRQFAWMTYLNDVKEGGRTEFVYYNKKIKPEKGLTIIWPTDWTHMHCAETTEDTKYIITGWLKLTPKGLAT